MAARTRLPRSATLRIRFYSGRDLLTYADIEADRQHHTIQLGACGEADVKIVREGGKASVTVTTPDGVTACYAKHKKPHRRRDRCCPK